MTRYRRRLIDDDLDVLMDGLAAISLEGPRAVGKTRTAMQRAATSYRLDDPATRAALELDPQRLARDPAPVLIDEWQFMPETWDVVRRAVDDDRRPGRFILTGSVIPRQPPMHSGAGRIVSLRMRPMSLVERGVAEPAVSLRELLGGSRPRLDGSTAVTAEQYAHEIVASGLPGLRDLDERAARLQLDGYLDLVVERDIEDAGQALRSPTNLRRWMRAYAAAIGSTTSYEKIRDAASAGHDEKPARTTVQRYLDALERMWIVEPVPAWIPARNDLSRLAAAPKHQLADPAFAARLRGASIGTLLDASAAASAAPRDARLFGALFEALVTLDVRSYAQAAEASVSHFRSGGGDREVDLIVEGEALRVLAIEVKLARTVVDADVRHLRWLQDRLGPDLLDAIVVTAGPYAYRRADGIGVVPAALLGP